MPPLAEPSSLVSTMPVTSTISLKTRAWMRPFWPVVASRTSSTSVTVGLLLDDALDLAELVHQPGLVLQAAGGVDEHGVDALLDAVLDGLERDAGRVAALGATHDLDADALAPRGELVDGGGAERVGGTERDR